MIDINKIYLGDCLDIMKLIDDNSIDCVIFSPPYNIGNIHHTNNDKHFPYEDNMKEEDYQKWQIDVLNEIYRLLKDSGNVFYNHKNRIKNGFTISPYEWILKTKFKVKQEITWKNGGPNLDKIRFFPMSEKIFWLSKSNTKLHNHLNLTDVWDYVDVMPEKNNPHRRAYPEKLVSNLISVSTEIGDIILDPFSGSGTTCKVAYNMDRKYLGIEKIDKYYSMSVQRLKVEMQRKKLF